jgi:hypothetical protein
MSGLGPWSERARCRDEDPELSFPENGKSSRPRRLICLGCPVRQECLDCALRHDERLIALLIGYKETGVLPDVDTEPSPESQLAAAELIERYPRRTNQRKRSR